MITVDSGPCGETGHYNVCGPAELLILVARKLRGEKKEWRENATLQVHILSDQPPPTRSHLLKSLLPLSSLLSSENP